MVWPWRARSSPAICKTRLLTIGLVGLYGIYRAATERGMAARLRALAMAVVLVGLGVLISGVQWVPSKELLDRSPAPAGCRGKT